ncbi:MAG: hypothetical protein V1810_02400 [Candidatus Beckwithbacteria bacterium]
MWNKYTITGVILFLGGMVLTVFIIGIPIMLVGWLLMSFGFVWGVIGWIPGGRNLVDKLKTKIIEAYKPYFHRK